MLALSGLLVVGLLAWGTLADRRPASQPALFTSFQAASLGGALLGAAWRARRLGSRRRLGSGFLAALISWRISYFPIMVFSGHVASIAVWLSCASGSPAVVYPVFLVTIAALHGGAAWLATLLVPPQRRGIYALVAPAFLLATLVSFSNSEDLRILPDRAWTLPQPVPPRREADANPYFPALLAPGYLPNQRLMLLAAGVTYETIPRSPWGSSVKAVLEHQFRANPRASTADRVLEHYLAYHSAHPLIGCGAPPERER